MSGHRFRDLSACPESPVAQHPSATLHDLIEAACKRAILRRGAQTRPYRIVPDVLPLRLERFIRSQQMIEGFQLPDLPGDPNGVDTLLRGGLPVLDQARDLTVSIEQRGGKEVNMVRHETRMRDRPSVLHRDAMETVRGGQDHPRRHEDATSSMATDGEEVDDLPVRGQPHRDSLQVFPAPAGRRAPHGITIGTHQNTPFDFPTVGRERLSPRDLPATSSACRAGTVESARPSRLFSIPTPRVTPPIPDGPPRADRREGPAGAGPFPPYNPAGNAKIRIGATHAPTSVRPVRDRPTGSRPPIAAPSGDRGTGSGRRLGERRRRERSAPRR